MPKAKTAPSKITQVAKTIVNKSGKALKAKIPAKPPAKAPVKAVKETSKPIKKSPKAAAVPTKPPTFKRPSAQPKKPMSSYMFFNAEMMTQMKDMDKFKNMPFMQRNQVVSQSWSKLKDVQKSEYEKCAVEDKKRYEREQKTLEKKGFFINKDGKDSRDLYKAPRKASNGDEEMKDDSPKKKSVKATKEEAKSKEIYEDDAVKPKKPLSGYMFFGMENRVKILKAKPDMPMLEVSKQNGADWNKLTDAQKKKFDAQKQKDQERYEKEMKEFEKTGFFTNSDGVNSKFLDKKHRVQEFAKGTVMPKSIKSAYLFYNMEQHANFKAQKKEDEKMNIVEKTKQFSEGWNAMTAAKKAKYEKLNQKDHERYEKELNDLRKNGFFINEEGVKSTDLPAPKPKKVVKKPKRTSSANKE